MEIYTESSIERQIDSKIYRKIERYIENRKICRLLLKYIIDGKLTRQIPFRRQEKSLYFWINIIIKRDRYIDYRYIDRQMARKLARQIPFR